MFSSLGNLLFGQSLNLDDDWHVYELRSQTYRLQLEKTIESELKEAGLIEQLPAPKGDGFVSLKIVDEHWFELDNSHAYLSTVRSYQCPSGGWSKSIDYKGDVRKTGQAFGPEPRYVSTFDNNATIPQIRLLARAYKHMELKADREAVLNGLYFIQDSQYPNGGWPQIYPLIGRYHDHITFNDNTTAHILHLLSDIKENHPDFEWLPEEERQSLAETFKRGISCVLDAQIRRDGTKLGWAQQYHARTLTPARARAYEMKAISSRETAKLIDFLMTIDEPSPEIVAAIDSAVGWLQASQINGYTFGEDENGQKALLPSETASPLWARFYDLETNEPLFGDRDGSIHTSLKAISEERRNGYGWFVNDPSSTLNRVRKWRAKRAP
ncbi:pectate lyase [Pelagicoccus mobilis]|uniref:Pectate lyase n=1 Tax=Pelagicoccus mobilis TaxID=415221 RepID=A0A934VNK5_9BACT|nr:pectate lyase [Pelagicoccus mobilis]MBK1876322.1 pectate lyase [Pelagicoccus mobilis]